MTASAELMSGFGAPAFTDIPIGDFTSSTRLSAITLPLLGEIVERIAHHDQDIGGFAALQPHRDRIDGGAHRRSVGGDHLVAGQALELRHQRIIGRRQSARDHHPDLGGSCRAGQEQSGCEAERKRAQVSGDRCHGYSSPAALDGPSIDGSDGISQIAVCHSGRSATRTDPESRSGRRTYFREIPGSRVLRAPSDAPIGASGMTDVTN